MADLRRRSWLWFHPGIERVIRGEQRWTVEHTDCLVALRAMGDCSVDACVCDPPYELGFMSKAWDKSGIAFRPDVWREVLRVLKPGGHLLAFGGTRTFHRIACAIEDAGFDIRDSIAYMHGQGFPKSLNLSQALSKERCQCDSASRLYGVREGIQHPGMLGEAGAKPDLFQEVLREGERAGTRQAQPPGARRMESDEPSVVPPKNDRSVQSCMAGRRNDLQDARELLGGPLRALSDGIHSDGEAGWVRDGTSTHHGASDPPVPDEDRGCAPQGPRSDKQHGVQSGDLAGQPESQVGGAWPTCRVCGRPSIPSGLGTALKPSFEPIIVARKPPIGTIAANVQAHGTGGLNIDACRVAHAGAADLAAHEAQVAALKSKGGSLGNSWKNTSDLAGANDVNTAGRWPPNALFSHDPGCVRLGTTEVPANPTWDTPNRQTEPSKFTGEKVSPVRHAERGKRPNAGAQVGSPNGDPRPNGPTYTVERVEQWRCVEGCAVAALARQSGESNSSGTEVGGNAHAAGIYSPRDKLGRGQIGKGDSGSAARFFPQLQAGPLDDITPFLYQSKPSTSERDAGLHHFRALTGAQMTDSEDGQARLDSPRTGAGRLGGRRNHHATVKSVDLMRWLIRLVTPPGGVVLDPFAGSGSGGVAAVLEGVRWIGFEMNDGDEEPSVSVARARISWGEGREVIPRESLRAKEPPKQRGLFEETGT